LALSTSDWGLTIYKDVNNLIRANVVQLTPLPPGTDQPIGTTELQSETWYYVVASSVPENKYKIYINGLLDDEEVTAAIRFRYGQTLYIGSLNTFFNLGDCDVSEVHTYNREITSSEVLQNFNATKSKYGY
jgi:hypothetical protein